MNKPRDALHTCPHLPELIDDLDREWQKAESSGEFTMRVYLGEFNILLDIVKGCLHPELYDWPEEQNAIIDAVADARQVLPLLSRECKGNARALCALSLLEINLNNIYNEASAFNASRLLMPDPKTNIKE